MCPLLRKGDCSRGKGIITTPAPGGLAFWNLLLDIISTGFIAKSSYTGVWLLNILTKYISMPMEGKRMFCYNDKNNTIKWWRTTVQVTWVLARFQTRTYIASTRNGRLNHRATTTYEENNFILYEKIYQELWNNGERDWLRPICIRDSKVPILSRWK